MTFSQIENPKAITTWSGFLYQGKVAIIACLKQLVENYQDSKYYNLYIEKLDDFSIHTATDDTISIHQVKCLKANTQGSYTDAIESLDTKRNGNNRIDCFLHVSVPITNFTETRISLFSYNTKTHLAICDVDDFKYQLIEDLIRNNFHDIAPTPSENDITAIGLLLDELVVTLVSAAHNDNQALDISLDNLNRKISFGQILDVIRHYNFGERVSEESLLDSLKCVFGLMISQFKIDFETDVNGSAHLDKIASKIFSLQSSKFYQFLKIINPEWSGDSIKTVRGALIAKPNGFDTPFLYFIAKSMEVGKFNDEKSRYEVQKDSELYIPYAYPDSAAMSKTLYVQKIISSMLKSSASAQLFYEGDVLVSNHHNIDNLFQYWTNINGGISPYLGESKSCFGPKELKIMAFRDALELLELES